MNPSNIKVTIDPNNQISARIGAQESIKIVSSVTKEIPTNSLKDLTDVSIVEDLNDGILIYNSSSQKWEKSDEINGGVY